MKNIEIDSFLDFKFLSCPLFSADGKYISFVVKKADLGKNSYKSDLYILENESGSMFQLTNSGDISSYCWNLEDTLLFSSLRDVNDRKKSDSGEEFTSFYEISIFGGEAKKAFTLPLDVSKIEKTGDDSYLISAVFDSRRPNFEELPCEERSHAMAIYKNPPYDVIDELPFWGNDRGMLSGKRTRLYSFNRKTNILKPLTPPLFDVESYSWDKDRIAIKGGEFENLKYSKAGIYFIDIDGGKLNCIIEPDTMLSRSAFMWGEQVLITATTGKNYGSMEYCDFYLYDIKTKKMAKLADYDYSVGNGTVNSDMRMGGGITAKIFSDKLYFISTVLNSSIIRTIDKSGNIENVIDLEGSADSFSVFGKDIVYVGMYGNNLQELYKNGSKITDINGNMDLQYSVQTPIPHSFTASDGFKLYGWAIKPLGHVEGKKYPAILHIHGGPRTVFGSIYHHEMQMWANKGYFVFFMNPRGSDGRGSEFGDISGKYGLEDYNNIMEFADFMLRQYPDADEKNFGVTGGSYGGFMTNWVIGHTNRFKAAVAQRSISNWISFEHTTDIGYFFTKEQIGASTREDAEKLWFHSPLKYADKVTTPTLFIQGDRDYRCWKVEAISMFTALKIHNVEAKLCLFKDESHELSRSGKPQSRIRRMEEILNWMDCHLKEQGEKTWKI